MSFSFVRATSTTLFTAALASCAAPTGAPAAAEAEPAFELAPIATTLEVDAGGEVSSYVELRRRAGFGGAVRMAFADLPPGFAQEWTRDSAGGDCTVVLKVAEGVAPGAYPLALVGQPDDEARLTALAPKAAPARAQSVVVVVGPGQTFNSFSLTATPSVFEVAQGNFATFHINTKKGTITQGDVALSVEGLPPGAGVTFAQNPVTLGSLTGTNAQLLVSLNVPPQAYQLKLRGKLGNVTKTSDLKLTVRPAADAGFVLGVNPASQTLIRGVGIGSNTPNAFVERLFGFGAPVTFSVQSLPPGVSAQVAPTPNGDLAFLHLSADPSAALGPASVTVRAEGGGVVKTVPLALDIVNAGPRPLATNQGGDALDGGFGDQGFAAVPGFFVVNAAVPLGAGRALVLGGKQFVNQGLAALVDANGEPDDGFGVGGFVDLPAAPTVGLQQADGKLVLAGNVPNCDGQGNCFGNDALVMRLRPDGTFDPSFGDSGRRLVPNAFAGAIAQAGGRLHLVSTTEIVRLTEAGALDGAFDGDGRKALPSLGLKSITSAALDAQGRLVAYGPSALNNQAAFARLSLDGALDIGFGQGGKASLPNFFPPPQAAPNALVLDPAGRVVIAGSRLDPSVTGNGRVAFAVARLTNTGTIDTAFDADGVAASSVGQALDESTSGAIAFGVAVTAGGKIVATGRVGESLQFQDYAAARWNDDGSVDGSFGDGGKLRFGFEFFPSFSGKPVEAFFAALPEADGRVVAFGTRRSFANITEVTIARIVP